MVSSQMINKLKKEYKSYLREMHPQWSASTINTYCSDAFYIANNNLVLNFWTCLVDDESMKEAYRQLLQYLIQEVQSTNAKERAKGYFSNLRRLKDFIDEFYHGVKQLVGNEIDAPSIIYRQVSRVYEKQISLSQAHQQLITELEHVESSYVKQIYLFFEHLMNGKKLIRWENTNLTIFLLEQIERDYGNDVLVNALRAVRGNILYHYEQTGNQFIRLRMFCQEIANRIGIQLSFQQEMFLGMDLKQKQDAWIFQGNPDYYSIQDYVTDQNEIIWRVCQHKNQIKKGDRVYLWMSGYEGGIIASGVITGDPKMKMRLADEYALLEENYQQYLAVEIKINGRTLTKPFSEEMMWQDERLKDVEILKHTDQINYQITNDQADLLDAYFAGNYTVSLLPSYSNYSDQEFLAEVFIDIKQYQILKALLRSKKNIILEGPPGVGKTFMARRLAYSLIGARDDRRVMMIQFHQSYSYEDFIGGFRPTKDGFTFRNGPFLDFCQLAQQDSRDYYFIIDEINRGNLSKIFGELLMLIEADKRGEANRLTLLYTDEQFYVPENVHIIGIMNTADRSLAMMDYALRRRFAFYPMEPLLSSPGFQQVVKNAQNEKLVSLVELVQRLNEYIKQDESLGRGFMIGHSYFCHQGIATDDWVTMVVEYELIPLINEYWFDEQSKLEKWSARLREVIR